VSIGNEPVEKPSVEICLDEKANILKYDTQPPSRPGYAITGQIDPLKRNVLLLSLPYINKGEEFSISIVSTGNERSECKVNILGLGVRARSRPPDRRFLLGFFFFGAIFPLLLLVLPPGLVLLGLISNSFLEPFGFYTATMPQPSLWLLIPGFAPFFLYLSYLSFIERRKERRKKKRFP
jgi:hypothetical protein